MPAAIALNKTVFALLPNSAKDAITALFDDYSQGVPLQFQNLATIAEQRELISSLLELHRQELAGLLPAYFPYVTNKAVERDPIEQALLYGFYLLSLQYYLDDKEHRRQTLKDLAAEMKETAALIYQIRAMSEPHTASPDQLEANHLKYLGQPVVTTPTSERFEKFKVNKVGSIREFMTEINGRRLYWVWGGGFLSSVLSLVPDEFAGKQPTQTVVDYPSRLTGYMSWVLYYARFGLNFSLLLKHTIPGPWMSKEEREQIPPWARFKTQWDLRKFTLLNDLIWATANLACFFWLVGSGMLGYFGNVLTAALLLMDVSLTYWKYTEEVAKHKKLIVQFESDLKELEKQIADQINLEAKWSLKTSLNLLESSKKLLEFDWKYKQYALMNDVGYAVGLLAAFIVASVFFFPPLCLLPATALLIGAIGAGLCFTVGLLYAFTGYAIESAKIKSTIEGTETDYQKVITLYQKGNAPVDIQKLAFLDLQLFTREKVFQEQVLHLQKLKLARSILIDASIPPVIFLSFMFMPFGVGLGILAAGLVLAVASKLILDKMEPARGEKPNLIEADFQRFKANPTLHRNLFFKTPSLSATPVPTEVAFQPT